MQLAVLGVGGAGGRFAERLVAAEADDRSYLADVRAYDTDPASLDALDLPEDHTYAIGGGHSFPDADATRATARESVADVRRHAAGAVDAEADAILVVAGMGGKTGAGVAPVLADAVRDGHDLPVYGLTVLPAADEEGVDDAVAVGVPAFEGAVDVQLLVDNEAVAAVPEPPEDPEEAARTYAEADARVADWLSVLFGAGESAESVGQSVVDASEIIATLGESGYAMVGCETRTVRDSPSLLDRLLGREESVDQIESYSTIETATRRALFRHRSFDADLSAATRSLLVTTGPPEWLNREAIADARGTVADETGASMVRGGDAPVPDGTDLAVLVLCAGMDRPARVAGYLD